MTRIKTATVWMRQRELHKAICHAYGMPYWSDFPIIVRVL